MTGRWWWESLTITTEKRRSVPILGLVCEAGTAPTATHPPHNPGSACTIGVGSVAQWIAHLEGLPP